MFKRKRKPQREMKLQPGDVIAFSGRSWVSTWINLATYGIPFYHISHVGIIGEHNGELLLFESDAFPSGPCVIKGKPISGTSASRLDSKLKTYCGAVWHYPLYRTLYDFERLRLNEFLIENIGIPYDKFGAMRSGGVAVNWLESLFRSADLGSLFCSEYVAAAHTHIGLFKTDNVSRWSPNRLVRAERKQGLLMKPRRLPCGPSVRCLSAQSCLVISQDVDSKPLPS